MFGESQNNLSHTDVGAPIVVFGAATGEGCMMAGSNNQEADTAT